MIQHSDRCYIKMNYMCRSTRKWILTKKAQHKDILRNVIRIAARVFISLLWRIFCIRTEREKAIDFRCREQKAASMLRWMKWKKSRPGSRMRFSCFGMRTGYRSLRIRMNRQDIRRATEILSKVLRCSLRMRITSHRILMIMMHILRSVPIRTWTLHSKMAWLRETGLDVFW